MPINKKHKAPFAFESFYHFHNRSVKGQMLFYSDENYKYFLKKFDEYLSGVFKVYAWSLLPNHFHFLLSVKQEMECLFTKKELELLEMDSNSLHFIITRRCKNFFIAYSLAIKNWYNINTNVFAQHYKNIEVDTDGYLSKLIYYIHHNPAHHHMTNDWQHYP